MGNSAIVFYKFLYQILSQVFKILAPRLSLTRVELVSLKIFFSASFGGCPLAVCQYGGGYHHQNPPQNPYFKVLAVFTSAKVLK